VAAACIDLKKNNGRGSAQAGPLFYWRFILLIISLVPAGAVGRTWTQSQ
jgi:hypothetical protein